MVMEGMFRAWFKDVSRNFRVIKFDQETGKVFFEIFFNEERG